MKTDPQLISQNSVSVDDAVKSKQLILKKRKLLNMNIINNTNKIRIKIAHKILNFLSYFTNVRGTTFFQNKIIKFLIPSLHGLVISPTLYGVNLLVNVDDYIGKMIYYFGEYETNILKFLKYALCKGDIFFDIGAYIGDISCIASKFVGNKGIVYAVEPVPDHYKILRSNIYLNNLKNITTFNLALGNRNAVENIYIKKDNNRGADSLIYTHNSIKTDLKIKVTTIDYLIEHQKINVPNVIKIDVEGFELNILKGTSKLLKSSEAPILIIEYNTFIPQSSGKTNDIYNFISTINNYSIYKFHIQKRRLYKIYKEEELPKFCNLFCFLDSHINKLKKKQKLKAF